MVFIYLDAVLLLSGGIILHRAFLSHPAEKLTIKGGLLRQMIARKSSSMNCLALSMGISPLCILELHLVTFSILRLLRGEVGFRFDWHPSSKLILGVNRNN